MMIMEAQEDGRVPCARCGRCFAADRIVKHQFVCAQLAMGPPKKPKEVGERVASVVQAAVAAKTGRHLGRAVTSRAGGGGGEERKPASKWRAASEELQSAMRAAREGAKLDALKAKGLVYFNGKPKPGVTQAQMRAASAPPKRTPLVAADGWAAEPEPSAAHAAATAAHERRQGERLAALEEIREMISADEYETKRQEIARAMPPPPPPPPVSAGQGSRSPSHSPPNRTPPSRTPPRATTQRPAPRPAPPTRAQKAHAAEMAAMQQATTARPASRGGGGGGYPGMSHMNRGSGGGDPFGGGGGGDPFGGGGGGGGGGRSGGMGGGGGGGGPLMTNNTSADNPFYRGY